MLATPGQDCAASQRQEIMTATFLMFQILVLVSLVCSQPMPSSPPLLQLLTFEFFPRNEILDLHFPPSIRTAETPIAVRYVLLQAVAYYERVAGCHPIALSFLGKRNPIPDDICASELRSLVVDRLLFYRLISKEFPLEAQPLGRFLHRVGLDPYNKTTDTATEIGWSNVVAAEISEYFATDGWNSQGDFRSDDFRAPFQDTTGYKPQNPAFLASNQLVRPLRWQPLTQQYDFRGEFASQVHVVPHIGLDAKPLSLSRAELNELKAPPLYHFPNEFKSISAKDKRKVLELITDLFEVSQGLTMRDVVISKFWEDKFLSLGAVLAFYNVQYEFPYEVLVSQGLADMIAQHDAVLLAWKEKRRHDYARPQTLIRHLLKGKTIRAFRGIQNGVGTVAAEVWEPVIPAQPHSEYPSASSAICAASMGTLKKLLYERYIRPNETIIPFSRVVREQVFDSSRDIIVNITYNNLDDAIEGCGLSRIAGGVHFRPAVKEGIKLGELLSEGASKQVQELFAGKVPLSCSRCRSFSRHLK